MEMRRRMEAVAERILQEPQASTPKMGSRMSFIH
jgi:hypothetical protein